MNTEKISQMFMMQGTVWLPKLFAAVLILLVFYIVFRILRVFILGISQRLELEPTLSLFFVRSMRVVILTFAMVTAMGTMGVDVSALVASLGLTGFALGFALKDTISNSLSGVLILLYHPFRMGDRIRVAGNEGHVDSIDLRYTQVKTEEGIALIPNSKLFTDPVIVLNKDQA